MKTICVTGGNGLLGCKLLAESEGQYRSVSIDLQNAPLFRFAGMEYVQGDITNFNAIRDMLARTRPDCVFHTAAYTDVDRCELDRDACRRVNVSGTEHVASICRSLSIKLIFLSTDGIFDGINGPYSEEDEPRPISYYGMTKWESEKDVASRLEDFIIARTTVLYGYCPGVRLNYVTWLIDKLRRNQRVNIVDDQYGTPTLTDDLAKILLTLFQRNKTGVFNTVGSEYLNRYDFALRVADVFDLDSHLIQRTTTDRLNQTARRPLRGGLKIEKVIRETGGSFSTTAQGLLIMKQQMVKDGVFPFTAIQ